MSDIEIAHPDEGSADSVENDSIADCSSLDEVNLSVDLEFQNESLVGESWCGSKTPSVTSVASDKILPSSKSKSKSTSSLPPSPSKQLEHGIILKQLVLKGITSQLVTAQSKLKSREATCITVSTWIGIGSRSGLVLVFDISQNLKWFLNTVDVLGTKFSNSESSSSDWGLAVSALAFNNDHSRLLVGNAKGHILEYDMKDGKLLRTLNDVHPPEAAILHLKYTDISTLALLCDSGGNVFELSFKRTLGVKGVDTRCIFSGSRGEVCALEPLKRGGLESTLTRILHPKWESSIVIAMATLSKLLIVQIRPSTKVIYTQTFEGDGRSPPCLGWHFVTVQNSRGKSLDPILAYGINHELHFLQLYVDSHDKIRCNSLLRFRLEFSLRTLQWLDSRMLALLDSQKQMHVVDIKSRETVDVVDVSSVELVSAAPFFQGLATGGNVSQALALVGKEAYYNSIAACTNQVLLLCANSVRLVGIRNWDERLDLLVSQSKHENAILLGLHMFDGKAKAMQGLKGSLQQRQMSIKNKLVIVVNELTESVLVPLLSAEESSARSGDNPRNLKDVIELCVDVCIRLDECSLLFDDIYSIVCNHEEARRYFLECLEPYFLNDRLIILPPGVMQQFILHYEDCGYLDALEQCIGHVDVSCLDLHQILTLSQNQGLYHAFLYVYTRALNDYITPLEDLMKHLQAAIRQGLPYSEQDIRLGHTMLVYISCCLAGRAYPVGEISEDLRVKVKHQVLTCLTCLHSKRALDDESPYPYLRTLLEFNTQELLNALSLAFEESEFAGEMGARRQQRVIDILIEIMINSTQFSPDQICSLFTFIARQISRNSHDSIHLDRTLFQQLLDLVCTQSSNEIQVQSRFEERQQALLLLLQLKGQPLLDSKDEDKLLIQARSAKFFRVCEYLYEQREDWEQVFECYVDDASRHPKMFKFLVNVFNNKLSASSAKRIKQMERTVLNRIQFLVSLNATDLAVFLATHKPHLISEVFKTLQSHPEEEYSYLEALIELGNQDNMALKNQVDSHMIEEFVSLMAQFHPERVAPYVQAIEGDNLPQLLEICRKFSLTEASSFILERQGDPTAAYDLLLCNLQDRIGQLFEPLQPEERTQDRCARFHSASQSVIDFCQRQNASMTELDREKIWLTLLDELLQPQRAGKEGKDAPNMDSILTVLREETQRVVTSVQGQVSLTKILPRLLQDPETTGGTLGDLRQLIMGLLENYNYETTLLRISTHLLQGDVHGLLAQRYRSSRRGVSVRTSRCSLCKYPLYSLHQNDNKAIVAFQCRHVFHHTCLETDSKLCVICNQIPIPVMRQENRNESAEIANEQIVTKLSSIQLDSVTKSRKMLASKLYNDELDFSDDSLQLSLPQF